MPPGPPQELVDATVTKLTEAQGQSDKPPSGDGMSLFERLRPLGCIARFAAAAVVLIVAGYAVGRVLAPQPPDMEELQAALEPAIRRNVIAQLSDELQSGLVTCYDQLSDELGRRHADEKLSTALTSFAVRTEAELERTKQGVAQLLSYGLPGRAAIHNPENSKNPDERTNQ